MVYDKSQTGWFLIAVFALIIVSVSVAHYKQLGENPLPENVYYLMLFIFSSLLLLLYKIRVVVDAEGVKVSYGIGLIRFRFNFEKINHVKEAKTSFLYGWGIRFIPGGMLYNIQGSDCVEISYFKKKNRIIKIGTKDADNLVTAIKKRYSLI